MQIPLYIHLDLQGLILSVCAILLLLVCLYVLLCIFPPFLSFLPPAVKVKKPHVCADPLATDLESKGTFAPTADAHQETPENRQQPERNDPELQDTQKELEGTQRKSPSVSIGPDPPSAAAASVTTEQQNPSRPSQKAESGHHSLSLSIYIGRCRAFTTV